MDKAGLQYMVELGQRVERLERENASLVRIARFFTNPEIYEGFAKAEYVWKDPLHRIIFSDSEKEHLTKLSRDIRNLLEKNETR